MKKIALIGCTGSIGGQVLDVVRAHRDEFCITALVCAEKGELLAALEEEFRPKIATLASKFRGKREELFDGCDAAFIAAGGFAGLSYTLAAIRARKTVLLANKESLVCGGELVMREALSHGVEIVPVDSEHSAIFQALHFDRRAKFSRLVLTASGGPFLHKTKEELARVTAEEALAHPTWKMGKKVTVDSATLLNKGYEVIEAKWLYGAEFAQIEAVVHPESIVHSLVYFEDGAALAQLGYPDMRVPIQLALTCPERLPCAPQLDFAAIGALHFERLPAEKFPCFTLALQAGRAGGTLPCALNAAAEVAVEAFLGRRISFLQIAETIEGVLMHAGRGEADSWEALSAADRAARAAAIELVYGK